MKMKILVLKVQQWTTKKNQFGKIAMRPKLLLRFERIPFEFLLRTGEDYSNGNIDRKTLSAARAAFVGPFLEAEDLQHLGVRSLKHREILKGIAAKEKRYK